ncbi:hypothetical protein DYQ86_26590 [Acidobacteria bacterium AB60]|nr:hypothetical protein DYQ86_26590 [Acidobacteria bacterium AB60]
MAANCISGGAPVARRVRAYFAPGKRGAEAPVVFDPSRQGGFDLDAPPVPWIDLGSIQGFTRSGTSRTAVMETGAPAAGFLQVRESLGAQVSFTFLNWTKLTMALATASQHMNVLAAASGGASAAVGAQAAPAVPVQSGSSATSLVLAGGDAAQFAAGQMIAVDIDYNGQTGFVGTPVAGAYLRKPLADVDYVRRVTFNVALAADVHANGLTLAQALPGGAPAAGAKVQALTGFVDREGGSFFQEWSGLFVMEGGLGDRIAYYYPRLQPATSAEETALPLAGKDKGKLERIALQARLLALPVTDPLDGERVVCYRSFVPAKNALV